MNDKQNYISDEMLEQLILQVEQKELVTAPPDLTKSILEACGILTKNVRKKEFYAYCFRVITSVAAAVVLVFLLPKMQGWMDAKMFLTESTGPGIYRQETPHYEEVVKSVPGKEEVLTAKASPTKEEVLDDSGFIDRMLKETSWFGNGKKNE